jgi:uncharacterized protein YbaR (Trm112 family)
MKLSIINKLCCPQDKADLTLKIITSDTDGNILEGYFDCKVCKRVYPIVKGVPIMNPDEYREFRLEQPLLEKWTGQTLENFKLLTT